MCKGPLVVPLSVAGGSAKSLLVLALSERQSRSWQSESGKRWRVQNYAGLKEVRQRARDRVCSPIDFSLGRWPAATSVQIHMAESSDSAGYSHLIAPDTSTVRKLLYVPGNPSGEKTASEQCVQSSSGTHLIVLLRCTAVRSFTKSYMWKGARRHADALQKVLAGCRAVCP